MDKMPTNKQISEQFYRTNQSWNYESTARTPSGKVLRVEIRRNSYDDQSYVHGLVFDTIHNKWNIIVSRPIATAACVAASYVREVEKIAPFWLDAASVIAEMQEIVQR